MPPRVWSYSAAVLGAGWPGAPIPANKSASDFVERTLFLGLALVSGVRVVHADRRFQVLRLFDAMGLFT